MMQDTMLAIELANGVKDDKKKTGLHGRIIVSKF